MSSRAFTVSGTQGIDPERVTMGVPNESRKQGPATNNPEPERSYMTT